eukprot:TRINITY_DN2403_c0_g1_i1.p1 TRINITY_DN2403_c0_g1~~TRINITY_DN2403_c0_g1_i1.p1  ORF type:complete len:150 (+),score=43.79 TRINITY_DN2403_c0_g1_i1:61-450(+)
MAQPVTKKMFCRSLKNPVAVDPVNQKGMYDGGLGPFNRAFIQGVVTTVLSGQAFLLDDGSGVVLVRNRAQTAVSPGAYLHVSGAFRGDCVIAYQIIDLSLNPNAEAIWFLEVIEYERLFSTPSVAADNP